jgi:hypothetical protein
MKKFYLGPKFGTFINRKWITNIWVVTDDEARRWRGGRGEARRGRRRRVARGSDGSGGG